MTRRNCAKCGASFVPKRPNQRYCKPAHRPGGNRTQRSTTDRGYGAEHQALKREWQKLIDTRGRVRCNAEVCLMASRDIYRGDEWDLGHTPDRSSWTGPEHPKCNRTEPQLRDAPAARRSPPKRWVP